MSKLNALIDNISNKTIIDFIRSKNGAFTENIENYPDIKIDDKFSDLTKIGSIEYDDSDSLLVFSCKYNDDLSSRNSKKLQFEIAKTLLKEDFKDGAIFIFYDEDGRFRFSFIRKNYGNTEQKYTPWKRYTYFVDKKTQTNRTFISSIDNASFSSLDKIQEGFSLEPLSKEFFYHYKEIYGKFVGYISGKYYKKKNSNWEETDYADHEPELTQFREEFNSSHKQVRDYVKKLLGRLVFLKFIEKKGWLGKIKDKKEIEPNFLQNLFKNSSHKDDFLDKVLEEVIFESLNNPIGNTNKCEELKKYSFPYLNGGLFEKDELDNKSIRFPKEYFEELFEFFNQYNFTIDENDPNDAEVSVDPEMLGHIFENLLEDNKDKGAFYTPKEIVHYMCQESLIEYLCTWLGFDTNEQKNLIIELVKTKEINEELKHSLDEIEKAVEKLKICDPAIGSGAFPMGLLQEIFSIKQSIHYNRHNTLNNFSAGEEKLNIIQNNIYGVDIEQGAVDIARLRFWLSLVVDETTPKALPNLDYKIMQGNSLIESFEGVDLSNIHNSNTGNVNIIESYKNLFGEYECSQTNIIFTETESIKKLNELMNSYFTIDKHNDRNECKKEIDKIITEQIEYNFSLKENQTERLLKNLEVLSNKTTRQKNKIEDLKTQLKIFKEKRERLKKISKIDEKPYFLWHIYFAEVFQQGGFDIVIGNPPYLKEGRASKSIFKSLKSSPYYQGKMDIWYMFACGGIDLLKENGVLFFIATNNWVTNDGASKLRKKIVNDAKILQLNDFGDFKIFENASIQTMTMFFSKDNQADNYQFEIRKLLNDADKSDMIDLISKNKTIKTIFQKQTFSRNKFLENLFTFSANEEIFSKIKKDKLFFEESEIAQGIVFPQDFLNNMNQNILGKFKIGDGIFGLSNEEKKNLKVNEKEKELIKPYYTTEQIHRYYADKQNTQWLIYTNSSYKNPNSLDEFPNIKNHLDKFAAIITSENKPYGLHRSRKEELFKGEKIVVQRKCVGKPSFSYSNFDCYVSATFFIIQTLRWNMKFLTGLLNSTLVAFWLRHKGKMQGKNFQVDKEPLLNIPLPLTNLNQQSIVFLVEKILEARQEKPQADTSELENEIDRLVYKLYDLTYEEVLVIDPDTPITKEEYELEIE